MAAVILLAAATASAGVRGSWSVVIGSGWAGGALGTAHNSADSMQYLEIQTRKSSASLYARDATGKSAMCTTTDPALVANARAVNSDSYVMFYWDGAGACTEILIETASQTEPKAP
ncbi:MAG TPA: hypothetical protein VL463_09300 [Kofleriaceae bacterium]|nr:hypothetical protein [Kofleriaceae bacterium]